MNIGLLESSVKLNNCRGFFPWPNYMIPFLLLLYMLISQDVFSQKNRNKLADPKRFWVDSVYNSLTVDEQIAQLLMLRTYSNKDGAYYKDIESLIKRYNIGGLCFFQGGPVNQASLTSRYQELSKTPLLIALDAEWGLGMRLDSTISFPYQMTLGAIPYDSLIKRMGYEIGRQLNMIGTHINFAPVVDINNNPLNPVIGMRSFGESKRMVAEKGICYMKGLQDAGIIATAKHFPGHGDTGSDSHYTLPVISHTREHLIENELYPFQQLINSGIKSIMAAHLYIPSLDDEKNTASSLSPMVINRLMENDMGFKGLKVTDALDMKGVTGYFKPGEIEVKAFLAGNDILLLPQDAGIAINSLKQALKNGIITKSQIEERCRKILSAKYDAGLAVKQNIILENLPARLNNSQAFYLESLLYENAVTIVRNMNNCIPIQRFDTLKIATVAIGSDNITYFQKMLNNYAMFEHYTIPKTESVTEYENVFRKLNPFDLVILSVHGTNIFPSKNYGIEQAEIDFILRLAKSKKVILDIFACPYALSCFSNPDIFESVIISYQDCKASQEVSAQVIAGSIGAKGKLPVSSGEFFKSGDGIETHPIGRLKYTTPEEIGIPSEDLNGIDSIIDRAIMQHVLPGCQIIAVKNKNIFYHKEFGFHTYDKKSPVNPDDLYDIASLTKIIASTPAVMKLYQEKTIDIDQYISQYLQYLKGSNKEKITLRELMAHQARLLPYINFSKRIMKGGFADTNLVSDKLSDRFNIRVADNMYVNKYFSYYIYDSIAASSLLENRTYVYSDLGFYLIRQIVEWMTNQPFEKYLEKYFYKPLGLNYLCFNPWLSFNPEKIIPTENDKAFRKQLIQGYVHDQGAGLMGGISGHAGLFSNAGNIAVFMQMLNDYGKYAGFRFLDSALVCEFTSRQYPLHGNRRGIGFDKPDTDYQGNSPACLSASPASFGHTGFTGTYAWADPEEDLIYVFLSNRVYPDAGHNMLAKLNIRTDIHELIYKAIRKNREW